MDNRWLSVEEIGAHLGVKRDTVYKWILRNGMPAHKAGRLWKFRMQDPQALAAQAHREGLLNRGKDVPSAPWYKVFKGDRINDHHLTLAQKREARGA
jgi:excisionase family DNA binding protein